MNKLAPKNVNIDKCEIEIEEEREEEKIEPIK